jgi:preprotein translocase subunit SecG
MMTLVIAIHVIACVGLIGIVLIQRGRGAGLVESFAGVESMFGTKTSVFLTRATTILSIVFFITCLSLAFLSVKRSKSLMPTTVPEKAQVTVIPKAEQPAAAASQAPAVPAQQTQAVP